uniref:AAA family ATPase n=1 Tax=Pseudomonas sp. NBRC 111136 TaxID=1661051 RepID=UPI000AE1F44F
MIEGYSEEEFGTTVHEHVRPAEPISSIELLKGRHKELEEIRRALFAKGRHMFIYGDRGIGKSSLAQTAALQYQSSDSDIIQIGCTRTSTFYEIMQSIAASLVENLG